MRAKLLGVASAVLCCAAFAAGASAKTVWLCKPGQKPDPCTPGLSTTVLTPSLKMIRVVHPKAVKHPAIDCFYVYPTVSDQPTGNATLNIDPVERSVALYQAARYSQYCRVFAPMYRQLTLAGIGQGKPTTTPNLALPISDLRTAFRTYLKRYNHGRGLVLIGQSQGADWLRQLIAEDVDSKPAVRRLMLSAILLGGNVLVSQGKDIGGDFKHIHACHSAAQLSCTIAFSTFDQPVPTPSLFGRPSPFFGAPVPSNTVVLCTNPAALGGGAGLVDPIVPSQPFFAGSILSQAIAGLGLPFPHPKTTWVSVPGAYRAQCSSANDANVLQIQPVGGAPTPEPSPTPAWGLHLIDAGIALGNLVSVVRSEAAAFVRSGR